MPKYTACLFGKQERTRKGDKKIVKISSSLNKKILGPGDLVFTDQYDSRKPGRLHIQYGGRQKVSKYKSGILFYDVETNTADVCNQISFTSEDKVTSKLKFEKKTLVQELQ